MVALRVVDTGPDVLSVSDRDRILQAMADCCAERGYRATTVDTVLERASVERESFEALFADKEDCALAALNKIVSETLARISMIDSRTGSAAEKRIPEIEAILQLLAARASFARLGGIEARQAGTRRMRDSYEAAVRVLALLMERAGTGTPGGSSSVTARAALGGAEALARRELAIGGASNLPKLLPDFVYAALVPFVGQREALRQARLAARVAEEG
jgi:AcrR family transcriptional regulator